jgi:hypothetical protein
MPNLQQSLGSIPASSYKVESKRWQIKRVEKSNIQKKTKKLRFNKNRLKLFSIERLERPTANVKFDDPSIFRQSRIGGSADKTVLNKAQHKKTKIPLQKRSYFCNL